MLAVFFGLTLQHVRIAPFAEVPLAIGVSLVLLRAHRRLQHRSNELVRGFGAIWLASFLLAGLPVLGLGLSTLGAHDPAQARESQIPASCDLQAAAAHLNGPDGLGDEPRVILTSIFYGSELLYRTDHKVLTGPYHRNDATILDTYDALTTPDDDVALSIVERREVDIVLLCPSQKEAVFFSSSAGETSLRERLLRGEAPAWLTPIAVPEAVGIQLWEVTS